MEYYTYTYLREDESPYYVGKGKGDRVTKSHKRQGIKVPIDHSRIKLLYWPDEELAIAYEIYQIDFWGRKDIGTGILRNRTDGGEKPPSSKGKKHSEASRKRMSEAQRGNKNNLGKPLSEETKRKISEARKGKSNFAGKKHTEDSKIKIAEAEKRTKREIKERTQNGNL
jgi:NUMOD3 motif